MGPALAGNRGSGHVRSVLVRAAGATLTGELSLPAQANGVVLFAQGSGRYSQAAAETVRWLDHVGLATLVVNLLLDDEEELDRANASLRFDIRFLADRLVGATDWLTSQPELVGLAVGYFGVETGVAAALAGAVRRPRKVKCIVGRGGRPDLADHALPAVQTPTLLIAGDQDPQGVRANESALQMLGAAMKRLVVIPGAGQSCDEPGKIEEVSRLAADWYIHHLAVFGRSDSRPES